MKNEFTYDEVGCTHPEAPPILGYHIHHRFARIGGPEVWDQARAAIAAWRMFDIDWITIEVDGAPAKGVIARVGARMGPLVLKNPCAVTQVYDSENHYGFSYGTLPGHAMSGEERFSVYLQDGGVHYEILAYSRPASLLARLGKPVVRHMQYRFGTESLAAMARAVSPT
jgi:uncharacterized protein (UPF0548 family)